MHGMVGCENVPYSKLEHGGTGNKESMGQLAEEEGSGYDALQF